MSAASQVARLIGYVRVSTEEQAQHGYGLDAQQAALQRASDYRRTLNDGAWEIVGWARDEGISGGSLQRPALLGALEQIAAGDVDGLAVAKLDRFTRSQRDFCELVDWFEDAGATLVMLEPEIATTSASGRAMAQVMVAFAEMERGMAAERTRAGLAAKRAKGEPVGRPSVSDRPELTERIQRMREDGMSLGAIAKQLTEEKIPTARGAAVWRPSSVQAAAGYVRPPARRKHAVLPEIRRRRRA